LSKALIQEEAHAEILQIGLNNPPVNALDSPLLQALRNALEKARDNCSIRSVVLTGQGKCFSAGLDLQFVLSFNNSQRRKLIEDLTLTLRSLYGFPKPVLAAVNGHAIAGGTILALACDYRIAVDTSSLMGLTEIRVGIPFPVCARVIVHTELDRSVARRLSLTGETMPTTQAINLGLLDELCKPKELLACTTEKARELGQIPAKAFGHIKEQLRGAALRELDACIDSGEEPMFEQLDLDEARQATQRVLKKQ